MASPVSMISSPKQDRPVETRTATLLCVKIDTGFRDQDPAVTSSPFCRRSGAHVLLLGLTSRATVESYKGACLDRADRGSDVGIGAGLSRHTVSTDSTVVYTSVVSEGTETSRPDFGSLVFFPSKRLRGASED